jgi:XRCC1 domain-containing protein
MSTSVMYVNKILDQPGVLSATSENPLYPISNLADQNSATVWRSVDANSIYYVVCDFGIAVNINSVAMANVNFSSSSVIKVQASTTSNFAVLGVDETITTSGLGTLGQFNLFWKLAQGYNFRYWRIEIDDTGGSVDGYYEIGEWFLGIHTTFASGQQPEVPWVRSAPDANVVHSTEWFHKYVYGRDIENIQHFNLFWRGVTSQTRLQLRTMKQTQKGSLKPFFLCLDDTQTAKESFYGHLVGNYDEEQETATRFNVRMNFEEQARGITLPTVE